MKKLPIGIQTFADISNDNYVYVDKTALAQQLIEKYKTVFLSRPRRFGKSLFLDTLHNIFAGNQALFSGLAIEQSYDWSQKYPVIRIDMSGNQQSFEECSSLIYNTLLHNQKRLGLGDCENSSISAFFDNLIVQAAEKYQQKVVVLVDEYDKPLLDNIDKSDLSERLRNLLQGFYTTLKKNDAYLKFVFFTGVSKISKVSIFSGLNNLYDISLDKDFATICGYTQNDIETTFSEYLQDVDLNMLKDWYNGYQFNGEPVYNPFDLLKFIANDKQYLNYWFETATPSFLIKQLQAKQYYLPNLSNLRVDSDFLHSYSMDDVSIESLLFQTGYLTLDKVEPLPMGGVMYHLRVPNKEVRMSLANSIIQAITAPTSPIVESRNALYSALYYADFTEMQNIIESIFANIPYHLHSNSPLAHYEGYYCVVIYSYLLSLGVDIQLEKSTNKGRLDMVVNITDKRYLIEFKMDDNDNALEQIKEKQYFQAFYDTEKQIYLIGIHFDEQQRNITTFEWEQYN